MLTINDSALKNDTAIFNLTSDTNPGKLFHVAMKICENPFCRCRIVSLMGWTGTAEKPGIYNYDLEKYKFKGFKIAPVDREWISAVKTMDETDRKSLASCFIAMKKKVIENADLSDFPKPVIPNLQGKESMVGFREVFPLASSFIFERKEVGEEEDRYLVDEQYCVDPACDCRHVAITIFLLTGQKRKAERLATLLVDYRTGRINEELFVGPMVGPESLVGWLIEAVPDVLRQFSSRHSRMKDVFRDRFPGVRENTNAASPEKPGRNDPCPCGSGKKYKKCCLGKQ